MASMCAVRRVSTDMSVRRPSRSPGTSATRPRFTFAQFLDDDTDGLRIVLHRLTGIANIVDLGDGRCVDLMGTWLQRADARLQRVPAPEATDLRSRLRARLGGSTTTRSLANFMIDITRPDVARWIDRVDGGRGDTARSAVRVRG